MSSLLNVIKNLQNIAQTEDVDRLDERLAFQIGTVIGASLPVVPGSGSANTTYQTTYQVKVRRLINDINELFILDIDAVSAVVKDVFTLRYDIVNNPQKGIDVITRHIQAQHEMDNSDIFRGGEFSQIQNSLGQYIQSLSVVEEPHDD